MDKLRMQSSNGVEDNITKIAQLFPDCVTETVDERSGQPKHLIDFEKLKQNLSDSVMSERAERYPVYLARQEQGDSPCQLSYQCHTSPLP